MEEEDDVDEDLFQKGEEIANEKGLKFLKLEPCSKNPEKIRIELNKSKKQVYELLDPKPVL